MAKLFIFIGIIFILIWIIIFIFQYFWINFGKLPWDINFKKDNFYFSFPIVSSIILSIVLTIVLNLIFVFFKK